MKQRQHKKQVLSFESAIRLALQTPKLTHKQIDKLKKEGKLKKLIN